MSKLDKIYDLAESVGAQLGVGLVSRRGDQIDLPLEVLAMMLRAAQVHGLEEAAGMANVRGKEYEEEARSLLGPALLQLGGSQALGALASRLRARAEAVRRGEG
jgi:hypothetical protein